MTTPNRKYAMNDPVHARPVTPPEPDLCGTGICSEDGHQLDAHGDCPQCGLNFDGYPDRPTVSQHPRFFRDPWSG